MLRVLLLFNQCVVAIYSFEHFILFFKISFNTVLYYYLIVNGFVKKNVSYAILSKINFYK